MSSSHSSVARVRWILLLCFLLMCTVLQCAVVTLEWIVEQRQQLDRGGTPNRKEETPSLVEGEMEDDEDEEESTADTALPLTLPTTPWERRDALHLDIPPHSRNPVTVADAQLGRAVPPDSFAAVGSNHLYHSGGSSSHNIHGGKNVGTEPVTGGTIRTAGAKRNGADEFVDWLEDRFGARRGGRGEEQIPVESWRLLWGVLCDFLPRYWYRHFLVSLLTFGSSATPTTRTLHRQNNQQNDKDASFVVENALHQLMQSSEMGNSQAQAMIANALSSGILPPGLVANRSTTNWQVPSDFARGGTQLHRAIVLWHMAAMDGNVESAMALGYRHFYSATSGTFQYTKLLNESGHLIHPHARFRRRRRQRSETDEGDDDGDDDVFDKHVARDTGRPLHYGTVGSCQSALAYYQAAANGVMDEWEASPLRGKTAPALDRHELLEMERAAGVLSRLAFHNWPEERPEVVDFLKTKGDPNRRPEPDVNAAYELANLYQYGWRSLEQNITLALRYYQVAADLNSWEAAGQAGKILLFGMGISEQDRNWTLAHKYFSRGIPGGLQSCWSRLHRQRRRKPGKMPWDDRKFTFSGDPEEKISQCDAPSLNGMGLLHLYGVPSLGIEANNIAVATDYLTLARELGNADAAYHLAMIRLGFWSDEESSSKDKPINTFVRGPSPRDFQVALWNLRMAGNRGHLAAKHRLGMIYSQGFQRLRGATTNTTTSSSTPQVLMKPSCPLALRYFREVAHTGTTVSRRNRRAYRLYRQGKLEPSLLEYLASAETGSVIGQINAAYILEGGTCLHLSPTECQKASFRLWKAAARQGHGGACLKVGDLYYYGRTGDDDNDGKDTVWSELILYPERWIMSRRGWWLLLQKARSFFLSFPRTPTDDGDDPDRWTMAAAYYRMATKFYETRPQAYFNLALFYQWGWGGFPQDGVMAQRYFDKALSTSDDGVLAVRLAQWILPIQIALQQDWQLIQTCGRMMQWFRTFHNETRATTTTAAAAAAANTNYAAQSPPQKTESSSSSSSSSS